MANGIGIINGFDVSSSSPIDKRYGIYTGTTIEGCLSGVTETIPQLYRYEGLTVGVKVNNEDVVEYWFKGGIGDNNLILKSTDTSIIDVTYLELLNLINTNSLKPLQEYKITDYKTTYVQPITLINMESSVTEPLIVEAITVNKLSLICKSTLYPQDVVYYNIDDNTEGFTKGKIFRRYDTQYNNDIGTDWRHIKYRRWIINVTDNWVINTVYTLGSVVEYNGYIYACISTTNGWEDINNNFINTNIINGEYISANENGVTFNYNNQTIIIPAGQQYKDVTMFNQE